jgi:exonuclease 3'-5' domain-containing protein 2
VPLHGPFLLVSKMPNQPARKTIYDNCVLIAPDNTKLALITRKRSDWYIEKKLAEVICQDPYTIKLKFKPAGKGNQGDEYYLTPKDNKCVVCGSEDSLNRHHVIPRIYRRHMPGKYKYNASHDVVALCIDCHTKYEVKASEHKNLIAKKFVYTPNYDELKRRYPEKYREYKARKYAGTLVNHREIIPLSRIKEMEQLVGEFLGDNTSNEQMQEFNSNLGQFISENMTHDAVKAMIDQVDIDEFVSDWRQHFVQTMKPKYLPTAWDVYRAVREE